MFPQECERFVLVDRVPQQFYGRMRMCRAMVNDHFTPAYLAAMASAVALFEGGYPTERMQSDGSNECGGRNEAAATRVADTLNASQDFKALERSIGGAHPSAAEDCAVSGRMCLDKASGGHVKAA